jgi:diaminopimelate epimerase
VASCINDETGRHVNVHTEGGLIEVLWREDGEVLMTGRADVVYSGEWIEHQESEDRRQETE